MFVCLLMGTHTSGRVGLSSMYIDCVVRIEHQQAHEQPRLNGATLLRPNIPSITNNARERYQDMNSQTGWNRIRIPKPLYTIYMYPYASFDHRLHMHIPVGTSTEKPLCYSALSTPRDMLFILELITRFRYYDIIVQYIASPTIINSHL